MKIKVNSEIKEIKCDKTVTQILELEKIQNPEMISVQLNGEFVDKVKFSSIVLKEDDEIDFLYFMGGGCFEF